MPIDVSQVIHQREIVGILGILYQCFIGGQSFVVLALYEIGITGKLTATDRGSGASSPQGVGLNSEVFTSFG